MKWEFLINPNSYESESSSHAMPKRKATKKQLRNLAKGRAIRKRNLLRKRKRTIRAKPKRKMAKRRRTNGTSLTGGTKDVNPQLITFSWQHPAATATHNINFHNPVAKGIFAQRNYATVMEVLKVIFYIPPYEDLSLAAQTLRLRRCCLSTSDLTTVTADGRIPTVFSLHEDSLYDSFTALGSMASGSILSVYEHDLTDGAGHGILLATDYIYLQSRLFPVFAGASEFAVKILYRFKNVGVTEYIGIVQSQQ